MYTFDTAAAARLLTVTVAKVPEIGSKGAVLTNPSRDAAFPVCVIQPPLLRPKYGEAAAEVSVTLEVWAKDAYAAMTLFDKVKQSMRTLCFTATNNTPLHMDAVTNKWRFGGYFECRWNAITNTFELNR